MNVGNVVKINSSVKLLTVCCLIGFSLNLSAHDKERSAKGMPKHERPQFSSLDLNGDGAVTYAEFEKHAVPNNNHANIFGHIDTDRDGELTEDEFTSHQPPRHQR